MRQTFNCALLEVNAFAIAFAPAVLIRQSSKLITSNCCSLGNAWSSHTRVSLSLITIVTFSKQLWRFTGVMNEADDARSVTKVACDTYIK